jgi:hypothetical protein
MPKADLLTPIRPLKDLHPLFLNLISHDVYEPARGMLREVYSQGYNDGGFSGAAMAGSPARPWIGPLCNGCSPTSRRLAHPR